MKPNYSTLDSFYGSREQEGMFNLTTTSHDCVFLACTSFGLRESEVDLWGKKEVKDVSVSTGLERL